MAVDIVMPQMGESIFEGTITKWLKKPGDRVERDEPLFEISTDKVDAEIPSPGAGVLLEIKVKEGDTVPVNSVVAVIGTPGEAGDSSGASAAAKNRRAITVREERDRRRRVAGCGGLLNGYLQEQVASVRRPVSTGPQGRSQVGTEERLQRVPCRDSSHEATGRRLHHKHQQPRRAQRVSKRSGVLRLEGRRECFQ